MSVTSSAFIVGHIAGDLAQWLKDQRMDHVRGAPFHPQTQGKIERWHQTLKNRIQLENYYLPGDPSFYCGLPVGRRADDGGKDD